MPSRWWQRGGSPCHFDQLHHELVGLRQHRQVPTEGQQLFNLHSDTLQRFTTEEKVEKNPMWNCLVSVRRSFEVNSPHFLQAAACTARSVCLLRTSASSLHWCPAPVLPLACRGRQIQWFKKKALKVSWPCCQKWSYWFGFMQVFVLTLISVVNLLICSEVNHNKFKPLKMPKEDANIHILLGVEDCDLNRWKDMLIKKKVPPTADVTLPVNPWAYKKHNN